MRLDSEPFLKELSSEALEPRLLVYPCVVEQDGTQAYLLVGNLHIRVPQGRAVSSIKTKQRLVREALAHLEYLMEEGQVAREAGPEGSARYVPRGK